MGDASMFPDEKRPGLEPRPCGCLAPSASPSGNKSGDLSFQIDIATVRLDLNALCQKPAKQFAGLEPGRLSAPAPPQDAEFLDGLALEHPHRLFDIGVNHAAVSAVSTVAVVMR